MQAKMSVNKAVGAKAQRSPATPLVAAHASVSPLGQRVTPVPQQAFPQMARSLAAEFKSMSGVASRSSVVASAWPSHVSPAADKGKTVIVTGASSGLGLQAARALAQEGWHVVMACRDFSKAEQAAALKGIPADAITILHLDLASLESVRQFVGNFRALGRPLDVLVANAAVYLPTAKEPTFNADGYELSVATNHLGHFLLCNLLLEDLKASKNPNKRMIIVGSITGQANTLAGKIPPQADLGQLQGMEQGFKKPISMIDGGEFNGAKAYKDSKVCNMLTMREFNRRYNSSTGVTFSSLYPGCIAETGLFRNHVKPFQVLFPAFQKYVTKGYVSEEDAGKRLAKVVSDPTYNVSGAYWSWKEGDEKFVNEVSNEVSDETKGRRLWELSEKLVGIKSTVSNDALGRQRVSVAV